MIKWEYKQIEQYSISDFQLNQFGNDGWEMCGVYVNKLSLGAIYYFKRQIKQ